MLKVTVTWTHCMLCLFLTLSDGIMKLNVESRFLAGLIWIRHTSSMLFKSNARNHQLWQWRHNKNNNENLWESGGLYQEWSRWNSPAGHARTYTNSLTQTQTHALTYTQSHTRANTHTYIIVHACTHTHSQSNTHNQMLARGAQTRMFTNRHSQINTITYLRTSHTLTHTCAHTLTQTFTHSRAHTHLLWIWGCEWCPV